MEINENKKKFIPNKRLKIERAIGIAFLIPPFIGVIIFILQFFVNIIHYYGIEPIWNVCYEGIEHRTASIYTVSNGPIYIGLLSIAGAILLKGTDKK